MKSRLHFFVPCLALAAGCLSLPSVRAEGPEPGVRPGRPAKPEARPESPRRPETARRHPESGDSEARIRHLLEASEHLALAGLEEESRHFRERAEQLKREHHAREKGGGRPSPPEALEMLEKTRRETEELRHLVDDLRREVQRLREEVSRERPRGG